MELIIYSADQVVGDPTNVCYPNRHVVGDQVGLAEAVSRDYTGVCFRDHRRRNENFIESTTLIFDVDNDHSDESSEWVCPDDVAEAFPGVGFAVHYSRNNGKQKGDKSPRPRFHILFPIDVVTSADDYANLKQRFAKLFRYFDIQALDASRFFAGTPEPQVEWHEGIMNLSEYLSSLDGGQDSAEPHRSTMAVPSSGATGMVPADTGAGIIPQGKRNSTLSGFAGRVLTRLGDTPEARQAYDDRVALCDPPLPTAEVETIWTSALAFYAAKVATKPGYVPPGQYNGSSASTGISYKPADPTDVGQAKVLAEHYGDILCFNRSLGYMVYRDGHWEADEVQARGYAQDLTQRQMCEVADTIRNESNKSCPNDTIIEQAKRRIADILKRRSSKAITGCLEEAKPMLDVPLDQFDADPFLLNTPAGTIDLRKGLIGLREHRPRDYLTQQTAVSPSDVGMDIWLDFLDTVFCGDADLIHYVQLEMGQMLVGKVFEEAMITAYGVGRNGKSTLFNSIAKVMGTYSSKVSANVMTAGTKHSNVQQELASARGKRLLIASEMTEGARLDDGTLKLLCSTDPVWARKLYKEPFSFIPSHMLVLYSNHLPRVSSLDPGTWRRLVIIPFTAVIEGDSDIKNYGEYLFKHAGGAILTWMIEGAKDAIDLGFKIEKPQAVLDAISSYREQNDWLGNFIFDACVTGDSDDCVVSTLELYKAYRNHCVDNEEYVRKPADFYVAVEGAGYKRKTVKRRQYFVGLRLRTDADDAEDNEDTVPAARVSTAPNCTAATPPSDNNFSDFLM